MKAIITVIGKVCPSCPIVVDVCKEIAKELNIQSKTADIDDPETLNIVKLYGFFIYDPDKKEIEYPVPQVFYYDGDIHHVFFYPMFTKEIAKREIKKRVKMLLNKQTFGKTFLIAEQFDIETIEDDETIPIASFNLPAMQKSNLIAVFRYGTDAYVLDLLAFAKFVDNDYKCPIKEKRCTFPNCETAKKSNCGIFIKIPKIPKGVNVDTFTKIYTNGRWWKLNINVLKAVIQNNFDCVCVKNRKCPCKEFKKLKKCTCRLFIPLEQ